MSQDAMDTGTTPRALGDGSSSWPRRSRSSFVGVLLLLIAGAGLLQGGTPAGGGQGAGADDRLLRILAGLRAREQAIEQLRGCFACEKHESASHWNRVQRALGQGGKPPEHRKEATRSVCIGEFMAAPGLFRLDGTMLNDGGPGAWCIMPRAAAPASARPGDEPAASVSTGARSVIIRDGEHELEYHQAENMQSTSPQARLGPPNTHPPLSELLFCDLRDDGLSHLLSTEPKGLPPAAKRVFECRHIGHEEIGTVPCAKVEAGYRTSNPDRPAATGTFWLAEQMGYAPVMSMHITWYVSPERAAAFCYFWLAEDYKEVPPGSALFMPGRVRTETAMGYTPGTIEWELIQRCEYFGLELNVPLARDDIVGWMPPVGTAHSSSAGLERPNRIVMRDRCAHAGRQLLQKPGDTQMDRRFRELVQRALQAGPPPPLAQ